MPWTPTSTTTEQWGRPQIIMDNQDVTFFRSAQGFPVTQVLSWTYNEPFDCSVAEIEFPQISPYEVLGSGSLAFLRDRAHVEIWRVAPNGARKLMWIGRYVSENTHASETEGHLVIQCVGALYCLDTIQTKPPVVQPSLRDIGFAIHISLANYYIGGLEPLDLVNTGILTQQSGAWNPLVTGFIQDMLAIATTSDGLNQWTLMLSDTNIRKPLLRLKDITTQHWRVRVGQPGVEFQVTRDSTMTPNAYYGEGVSTKACRWRNTYYPMIAPTSFYTPPPFGGTTLTLGSTGADVTTWQQMLQNKGYFSDAPTGTFRAIDQQATRLIQAAGGLTVTGNVDSATWNVGFATGGNSQDFLAAGIRPLAYDPAWSPWLFNADGSISGPNPNWNRDLLIIDRFENFGDNVDKAAAIRSVVAERVRDAVPDYVGAITLTDDPGDGTLAVAGSSRFDIKAGQNIVLQGLRGTDRLFHISQAVVNYDAGNVELTVDTKFRDLLTLAQIEERNRASVEPARRPSPTHRDSRQTEDRFPIWDCESRAGTIFPFAAFGAQWTTIGLPAAGKGTFVRTEVSLRASADPNSALVAAKFSVAIFDRWMTPNDLNSRIPNPLVNVTVGGTQRDPWDTFPENLGLVVAWGGPGQACGFYSPTLPAGAEDQGDPVTGQFVDSASVDFESFQPPWLWFAIWPASPAFIHGRLYPGVAPI